VQARTTLFNLVTGLDRPTVARSVRWEAITGFSRRAEDPLSAWPRLRNLSVMECPDRRATRLLAVKRHTTDRPLLELGLALCDPLRVRAEEEQLREEVRGSCEVWRSVSCQRIDQRP